jgi:hypothetical protein
MPPDMAGAPAGSFPMRLLLLATSTVLFLVSPAFGSTDFSGTWTLDLGASSSPDPILKRLGASWIERQFGGSLQLESTYIQTPQLLTVHLRGVGFQRTDVMPIDNKAQPKKDSLIGRYTIRTFWSGNQLNSVISLRTKDSRDAQLTIVRELADGGKTLILTGTMTIDGESGSWTLCRVWRKRES